jgi:hypothetical protein
MLSADREVHNTVEQILALLQRTLNDFLGSKGLGTDHVVISNISVSFSVSFGDSALNRAKNV